MTGLAQLSGASQDEIQEAVLVAAGVGRDSIYLNGIALDLDQFMNELQQIAAHLGKASGS